MFSFAEHDADYIQHFKVLERAAVLAKPSLADGKPLVIEDRRTLDELGFAFFAAWVFKALLEDKIGTALIPLDPSGDRTGLVLFERRPSPLAHPRSVRTTAGQVDAEYLRCPYDELGGLPPRTRQIFCPVLNRLRLNVGSLGERAEAAPLPPHSSDCCNSAKAKLWKYLAETVVTAPDAHRALLGGTVLPLRLPTTLVDQYMTGADGSEWSKWLDEILLWHAMEASGALIGHAHTAIKAPFESFEIDFLLRICDGKTPETTKALCVFETTVGHRKELRVDDDPERAQHGHDHPKNKLINHLALRTLDARYEYHYLCITESSTSPTVARALTDTEGFAYWNHDDRSLAAIIQNHLVDPVPVATIRGWYETLVEKVRSVAAAFAKAGAH